MLLVIAYALCTASKDELTYPRWNWCLIEISVYRASIVSHRWKSIKFVRKLREEIRKLRPYPLTKWVRTKFLFFDLANCKLIFIRINKMQQPLDVPYEGAVKIWKPVNLYTVSYVQRLNISELNFKCLDFTRQAKIKTIQLLKKFNK